MSSRQSNELNHKGLRLNIQSASREASLRSDVWTTHTDQPAELEEEAKHNSRASNGTKKDKSLSEKKRRKEKEGTCRTPPVVEPYLSFRERYLSWRYAMVFLLHSSYVVSVFLRNNMPIALVCMTHQPTSSSPTLSSSVSSNVTTESLTAEVSRAFIDGPGNASLTTIEPPASNREFSWDSQTQGLILTSSMLLSFAGPLLATSLQACVSSKHMLSGAFLLSAVLTLLCPLAARLSPYCLVAVRVLLGILLGANVPVVGDSLAWWAPLGEKLTMVSFTYTGVNVAAIISPALSGFMCTIPVDNGWPFIFYVFGGLALVWGVAWHFLSSQRPDNHPFISDREKEYIVEHRKGMEDDGQTTRERPPYLKILTSVPVLAFLLTACCHNWSLVVTFTYVPAFFTDILGFSVQEVGILMSVFGLVRLLGGLMWAAIGNVLTARFSTRVSRKVTLVTAFSIAGSSAIGMSFFGPDQRWLSYSALLVCMLSQSCAVSTLTVLPLDMAPRYAGLLTGIFISSSGLVVTSGPFIVASIVAEGSQAEWQLVWCIMGGVILLAALVFGGLGSATLQPWAAVNRPPPVQDIASPPLTPQAYPVGAPSADDVSGGGGENGSWSRGPFDFSISVPDVGLDDALPSVSNGDTIKELPVTQPGAASEAGGDSRRTRALDSCSCKTTGPAREENEEGEDVWNKTQKRLGGLENVAYENDDVGEATRGGGSTRSENGRSAWEDQVHRDSDERTVGTPRSNRFAEEESGDIDEGTIKTSQRKHDSIISIRL